MTISDYDGRHIRNLPQTNTGQGEYFCYDKAGDELWDKINLFILLQ